MYDDATLKQSGIYAIVNMVTGRMYVGRTCYNFPVRWIKHRGDLNRNRHHCRDLQKDWIVYGSDVFEFRILELLKPYSDDRLYIQLERHYINQASFGTYNTR